jgi:hypothetical protein
MERPVAGLPIALNNRYVLMYLGNWLAYCLPGMQLTDKRDRFRVSEVRRSLTSFSRRAAQLLRVWSGILQSLEFLPQLWSSTRRGC